MSQSQFANANVTNIVTTFIAAGQSVSSLVDLGGLRLRAIALASNWTVSTIQFYVPPTQYATQPGSAVVCYTDPTYTSTIVAIQGASGGQFITLFPPHFDAINYVYLKSSINQVSDQTILLYCTPLYQGIHG